MENHVRKTTKWKGSFEGHHEDSIHRTSKQDELDRIEENGGFNLREEQGHRLGHGNTSD